MKIKFLTYIEQITETQSELDISRVNTQIDNYLQSKGSQCFIIQYGIDEQELWDNFGYFLEIIDHMQDGDEVYLDITHSFRSLSLMSFVMSEFAKIHKNFKISGVYYGIFEYQKTQ